MLFQLISIIYIVSKCIVLCDSTQMSEINETNAFLAIKTELTELRLEQALIRADQSVNREELRLIRSELERQRTLLEEILRNFDKFTHKSEGLYGRSCDEATAVFKHNAIYEILIPSYSNLPFKVDCDAQTWGGGWTILMRRMDGSENFYRNWTDYKTGFGNIEREFFLGLDRIHALTADRRQELLVILEDFKGDIRYEMYEEFAIGDELQAYALHTLGNASGTAGDSLREHFGQKFTTFDRDNDRNPKNCAEVYTGAWWYKGCHRSNLAGKYNDNSYGKGVNWYDFHGVEYSLKRAIMMIRPKK